MPLLGIDIQLQIPVMEQNPKFVWDTLKVTRSYKGVETGSLTNFISPQMVLLKNKTYSGKRLKISIFHIKIWISGISKIFF